MKTHDRSQTFFGCWVRPLLIGTAVGIVTCTLLLVIMAAVIQRVDIPRGMTQPLAISAAAVGSLTAGLTAAMLAGRRGLLLGAVTGLVLFLLVLLAGIARYTAVDGATSLLKLAVLTGAGAVGGVLGVNRRRR